MMLCWGPRATALSRDKSGGAAGGRRDCGARLWCRAGRARVLAMTLTMQASIEPARLSLFLALGLLGCGSGGGSSDGDTGGGTTQAASTGSSGVASTGAATGTGEPTGGGSGSSASSGDASSGALTTGSTGETSGVSASTGGPGGGSTGGSTDGGSSGGGETVGPECTQLMQGFVDPPVPSGWEKCGDLLPHRVSAEACVVPATPGNCDLVDQPCQIDADCKEQAFGSCQKFSVQIIGCGCVYGCETDADCGPGLVCRCAGDVLGPWTRCVASSCDDDADCEGELCQFSQSEGNDCGAEVVNGACTTAKDACQSDPPCVDTPCAFGEGKWECSGVACGRPFVVEAVAVTAPSCARDDWGTAVAGVLVAVEPRARLAAAWTEIAAAEHASVASFARFILQLLAVGAPPTLVLAAQQALADEVEHARVAFGLASAYAGRGVGPGPLPQANACGPATLDEIVAAVIREACVGETLSALELREAVARAEDAGLRRILSGIAADEQRHAELGWRFVQWALAGASGEQQARAQASFAAAIAAAEADAERMSRGTGCPELRAHGVIDAPLRAAVWRRGLRGLVMPAAAALRAA